MNKQYLNKQTIMVLALLGGSLSLMTNSNLNAVGRGDRISKLQIAAREGIQRGAAAQSTALAQQKEIELLKSQLENRAHAGLGQPVGVIDPMGPKMGLTKFIVRHKGKVLIVTVLGVAATTLFRLGMVPAIEVSELLQSMTVIPSACIDSLKGYFSKIRMPKGSLIQESMTGTLKSSSFTDQMLEHGISS